MLYFNFNQQVVFHVILTLNIFICWYIECESVIWFIPISMHFWFNQICLECVWICLQFLFVVPAHFPAGPTQRLPGRQTPGQQTFCSKVPPSSTANLLTIPIICSDAINTAFHTLASQSLPSNSRWETNDNKYSDSGASVSWRSWREADMKGVASWSWTLQQEFPEWIINCAI